MPTKILLLSLLITLIFPFYCQPVFGEEKKSTQQYLKAKIISADYKDIEKPNVKIEIVEGKLLGKIYDVGLISDGKNESEQYKVGDLVIMSFSKDQKGKEITYIVDRVRLNSIYLLFGLFVIVAVLIGRFYGLLSIFGMGFSFLIIIQFIIPQIILGNNPIIIALLGGLIITPVTFYTSHGFKKKTTVAIVGTFIALMLTGLLSWFFVEIAHLSGFSADDSVFIQTMINQSINMKNLLLAGMIIGVMGILDDITVSQSSLVFKLAETNPKFSFKELFFHSMEVGKDHIASLVNTLILVYAGTSLPLFLLFYSTQQPLSLILNSEIIATELVRMFVGSIGLIMAVPITTFLACLMRK